MRKEVAKFLEGIQARQESLDTWKSRRSALTELERWCNSKDVRFVRQLTRELIHDYILELGKKPRSNGRCLKPASLASKAQAIRTFCKWLHSFGYTQKLIQVDVPKVPIDLPKGLALDEIEKLLARCRGEHTLLGYRDEAIIEFLYSTGSRINGLCKLNLSDLNFQERTALIWGKGRRRYLAVLTTQAATILERYIARYRIRGRCPDDDLAVFTSQRGRRVGRETVWEMLQKRRRQVGLPRLHAHQFRHAMATHVWRSSHDLRTVGALLGHTNLNSTLRYVATTTDHLRDQLDLHHPRARPCSTPSSPPTPPSS